MIDVKDVALMLLIWFVIFVPFISYEYLQLEEAASSSVQCHAD